MIDGAFRIPSEVQRLFKAAASKLVFVPLALKLKHNLRIVRKKTARMQRTPQGLTFPFFETIS